MENIVTVGRFLQNCICKEKLHTIFLMLIVFVQYIKSYTFEGCQRDFSDVTNVWLNCDFNYRSLTEGDKRRLTVCFMPQLSFQDLSVYHSTNSNSNFVTLKNNIVRNSWNKLEFTVKEQRHTRQGRLYQYVIRDQNKQIYSSEVLFKMLKNQTTRIQFRGEVMVSTDFFFTNAIHSTNCEEQQQPSTFRGCFADSSTKSTSPITSCYFDNFYPIKIGGTKRLKVCFQPRPSFKGFKIEFYNSNGTFPKYSKKADSVQFEIDTWNEVVLTIKKYNSETLEFKYQNSAPSLVPLRYLQFVKLSFIGNWKGSQTFSSESDFEFVNCIRESRSKLPTQTPQTADEPELIIDLHSPRWTIYIIVIVCSVILTIGLICITVRILQYRKKRNMTAGVTTNEIPNLEINKDTQNKRARDDIGPCYINVMSDAECTDPHQLKENEEILYADVSFGDGGNKKEKKSKKTGKKTLKVSKNKDIRSSTEEIEEIIYSTILPEIPLGGEEVHYVNVSEHSMDYRPGRADNEIVF